MRWWRNIAADFASVTQYGPQFLGEEREWVKRWRKKRERKRAT